MRENLPGGGCRRLSHRPVCRAPRQRSVDILPASEGHSHDWQGLPRICSAVEEPWLREGGLHDGKKDAEIAFFFHCLCFMLIFSQPGTLKSKSKI